MLFWRATSTLHRSMTSRVVGSEAASRPSYTSTPLTENAHVDKVLIFLRDNGALDLDHGPVQIKASRHVPGEKFVGDNKTKVVHFQRHGQGYHNLIYGILDAANAPVPDVYLSDIQKNPFLRSELTDSPLTELGREQCRVQKEYASNLSPEVIVVSPLCRALQTALITFESFRGKIPFISHDGCREELGLLTCNKRKILSEKVSEYPNVDFSIVAETAEEEDNLWDPEKRECPKAQSKRIYEFLVDFIKDRPEGELAVVGHSAWLFSMCHTVLDFGDESDELKDWFKTGEIRSLRLTFTEEVR